MDSSSQNETVSVIIPSFNRVHVLGRAIDSVRTQTRPPDEIIIVDDGSTDGTDRLIEKRYPDCIYLYQTNHGVSYARNRGIERASGKWLTFLDSDDAWHPQKLAKQLEALSAYQDYRICHTNEIWIRKGRRVNPLKKHAKSGGDIFMQCLPRCVISPSTVMLHHTLLRDYGNFDESLPVCEDYDLWLRLCAFMPVLYLPETLITKYGGHHDQLSRKFWGIDRFRIRALEKIIVSPQLSGKKRQAAVQMLLKKINIYLNGALKRGHKEDIEIFEALKIRYTRIRDG